MKARVHPNTNTRAARLRQVSAAPADIIVEPMRTMIEMV